MRVIVVVVENVEEKLNDFTVSVCHVFGTQLLHATSHGIKGLEPDSRWGWKSLGLYKGHYANGRDGCRRDGFERVKDFGDGSRDG